MDIEKLFIRFELFLKILFYLGGVFIFIACLIISYAVLMRYLVHSPITWCTEIAVYLGIFAAFLGAPYGLKVGSHIKLDFVIRKVVPAKYIPVVFAFHNLLGFVFCAVLTYKGAHLWYRAFSGGWVSGSITGVPLSYVYAMLPLGFLLLGIQFVIETIKLFHLKKV